MKLNNKWLFLAAFVVLALPLMLVGTAGAYNPHTDGATLNASGGWDLPADLGYCFGADTNGAAYGTLSAYTTFPDCKAASSSDILALSQTDCTAAGLRWNSHDAVPACSNNWLFTGTYDGNDQCLRCHNSVTQRVSEAAQKDSYLRTGHRNMLRKVIDNGGTGVIYPLGDGDYTGGAPGSAPYTAIDWTNGTLASDHTTPVYYIYGGYYGNIVKARISQTAVVRDNPRTVAGTSTYTCGQCHTTGWNVAGGTEPSNGASASGIWWFDGIQCARCHDQNFDQRHNAGAPEYEEATELCYQCHEQSVEPGVEVGVGSHGSYAAAFDGHYRTNQYLNSPHARFEGTEGQITDSTAYESHFMNFATGNNYGCAKCHDVHVGSADPSNTDVSQIKRDAMCGVTCHTYKKISDINHPTGPGTPLFDVSTDTGKMEACVTCHMGPGTNHLFRINIDTNYTVFPTKAEFDAGQKIANSYDEDGFPAVGMDLDLACGQCHGGGTDATSNPPKAGVPYMSKSYLASVAHNMHSTAPARFNWSAGSACYSVNVDATANSGSNDSVTKFAWTWGDDANPGTTTCNANNTVCTHTYTAAGNYDVTLTINYGASSRTMAVTAKGSNQIPTAGMSVAVDPSDTTGMTVAVTDGSGSNACGSSDTTGTAIILWGDGTTDVAATDIGITSTIHTYKVKGTYTIRYAFKDSNNNKAMAAPVTISVPNASAPGAGLFTVSGTITYAVGTPCYDLDGDGLYNSAGEVCEGNGISNAKITIVTGGGSIVKMGKTDSNGDYTISGVQGGQTYTVVVEKNGLTFAPVTDDQVDITDGTADFIGTFQ